MHCMVIRLVLSQDTFTKKQSGEPSRIPWASTHFFDSANVGTFYIWPALMQKGIWIYSSRDNKFYCCKA